MGNRNFTNRQAGAAQTTRKSCANTGVTEEDWSQHPDWSNLPDFELAPSCFRMALQAPAKFRTAMKKESTFSTVWDTGASVSVSPSKDDFVGPVSSPGIGTQLKGIVKGLSIQGKGHVMWPVLDTSGQLPPSYAEVAASDAASSSGAAAAAWAPRFIDIRSFRLRLRI